MSMNHLCCCTGVSDCKLELPKHREISNSCKICGGKPLVDGQRALPGSMLSNVGLEIFGIIDPHLNWKTAPKGKPRAVRRARTSFTSIIKGQSSEKVLEDNENLNKKESKRSKEMPVSESEKLGVTILGQRFSDAIESVPIKKRRFLFRSPSPPPQSPFLGDESGHTLVSQVTSHESRAAQDSNTKHHSLKISSVYKTGLDEEKADLDDIEERLCDVVDFSGISILAAAACNSSSGDDVMTDESLYSKQCSFRRDGLTGISESQLSNGNNNFKEQDCDIAPVLDNKMDVPLDNTAKLSCRGEDVAMMVSSNLEEGSSRSLLTVSNKGNEGLEGTGSSRDDRFHWDLNTLMEAWETPCDGAITDPQPVPSNAVNEDVIHGHKVFKQENLEGKMVQDHSNSVGKIVDEIVNFGRLSVCNYESKNVMKSDSQCNGSFADHDDGSLQERQLSCASVQVADLVEEAGALNDEGPSDFTKDVKYSVLGHDPDPLSNSPSAKNCDPEEVMTDTDTSGVGSSMENETRVNLHLNGSSSTENPVYESEPWNPVCESEPRNPVCEYEPHSIMDPTSPEIVPSEKTFVGSEINLCKYSDGCGSADVQIGETVQAGEAMCFYPDLDASKLDDCHVGPVGEQASSILVDRELCKVPTGEDAGQTEPFSEKKSDVIHLLTEDGKNTCLPKPVASILRGSINDEENSGGCLAKNEWVNSEKAGPQGNRTILTDQNGHCMEFGHHNHMESKDSLTPNVADGCPLTIASDATYKNYNGHLVSSPVENALDDDFDCDYYSDASQNEQAIAGMEKVEQQAYDESQYEDGEFRESFVHSWEMDGGDEGEAEHVDYGSDNNKEIDAFEAASGCPVSNIFSLVGSSEHANEGLMVDGHADEGHNVKGLKVEPINFLSSDAVGSDGVTNKKAVGVMKEGQSVVHSRRKYAYMEWEKSAKDATESGAHTDKLIEDKELVEEGDGMRERSHSASLRMKLSGWDWMPGCRRSCEDEVADSGMDNHDAAPEKLWTAGSTLKRELSSRIEKSKSPDTLHRKDRAYIRGSRNHDNSSDLHHDVKRDVDLGISERRDNSSVHMRCRGRGDRWIPSSGHQGPSRHDSPRYCNRAGFMHPGSKNAAAVSIAKVESNGFVVAPDGTVLEASVGPSGRLPRRSSNSSSNARRTLRRRGSPIERDETLSFENQLDLGSRRELSPGRHISIVHGRPGRYASKPVSEGNIERYHGFTPDDGIGSSLAVNHSFSSRQRSFSPQTRPGQVSRPHTRSRSRSRTHSPPAWTSPRLSNLINNGLRRRIRSPSDFRIEARVDRARSPHGRSGFAGRVTSFAPSSRNRASPLRASRWINERKELIEHLRDPDYRRFSGRTPPKRLFSRSHRFNPVDSAGRLKPDEFYRPPIHSGRFTEFNVSRGHRPDDGDGDRRHLDRYEMLPSERHYDILGDVKRLRYEHEDRLELHNDCSNNVPEFPERGSPRNFGRVVASRLNNSPLRAKEETNHFRYIRDGKHKASYKAFEVRECDEDGTPQRRRHS